MNTFLTTYPEIAAEYIKQGGIVAFPTETVYGLGANVFDETAVAKLFEAKRRPPDNPLIAHIAQIEQIKELTSAVNPAGQAFVRSFFPGPLSLVLPKSPRVPLIATAGLSTIGIRMPESKLAHEFLSACGVPVVAPSANLSGRPSPTTWRAVLEDLEGRIDCILQGDETEIGLESTVVDCSDDVPVLLRQGAISLEELRSVVPETKSFECTDVEAPRSPGQKHVHYKPKAEVVIVGLLNAGGGFKPDSAYIGVGEKGVAEGFLYSKVCGSVEEYAHSLYEFLRECDRKGIRTIYCQEVAEDGIGAAVMDRLRRAAA